MTDSTGSPRSSYEIPKSAISKLPHDAPPKLPPRNLRNRSFPDEDYEYIPNTKAATFPFDSQENQQSPCLSLSGWKVFWIVISALNFLILLTVLILFLVLGVPGSRSTASNSQTSRFFSNDSSKCSSGYSWFEPTQYCYRVSVKHSSYEKASKDCQSEGGHVASIHSSEENDFAVNLYKATLAKYRFEVDILHKRADLWLGLVYDKDRKQWDWSDGSTGNFTNWAENEPNRLDVGEFCTHIGLDEIPGYNPDGDKWNNIGSSYQAAYICKKKPEE